MASPECVDDDSCASGGCQIGDLFRLLGRAHVLAILYDLNHEAPGPRRFVEMQDQLGISPNTLSERLKDLVAAGLVTRTVYGEIPPRVEYEATEKGRDLGTVFGALKEWAMRHDLRPAEAAPERATA